MSGRTLGLGLIAVGFLSAVAGGLYLAIQLNGGQAELGTTAAASLPLFTVVALLVGAGLYLYSRAEVGAEVVVNTEMLKPRELSDLLIARGQLKLSEAAQALGLSENEVKATLDGLATLEVFSGYSNWDDAVLGALGPEALKAMQTCIICESPIHIKSPGQTICMVCRTAYYLPTQTQDKE